MVVIKHEIQSCCGNKAFLWEIPKPIRRENLQKFIDAGFSAPLSFAEVGIFYIEKDGLIVSGAYLNTKLNLRLTKGKDCTKVLTDFETIIESM